MLQTFEDPNDPIIPNKPYEQKVAEFDSEPSIAKLEQISDTEDARIKASLETMIATAANALQCPAWQQFHTQKNIEELYRVVEHIHDYLYGD